MNLPSIQGITTMMQYIPSYESTTISIMTPIKHQDQKSQALVWPGVISPSTGFSQHISLPSHHAKFHKTHFGLWFVW